MLTIIGNYIGFVIKEHKSAAYVGLGMLALFPVMGILSFFDTRLVSDINAWYKPMKFTVSVGIYLLTMIGVIYVLNIKDKSKNLLMNIVLWVMTAELSLIVFQGARGVASHFNDSSLFNALVFDFMGCLIAVNTVVLLLIAIYFFMPKKKPAGIPSNRVLMIQMGLLLILFSSVIGGKMVGLNHHLATAHEPFAVLPFFNWKLGSGDLRIAHFMGMHGLQIFPFLAVGLERLWRNGHESSIRRFLVSFGILYSAIVVFLFFASLN